MPKALERQNHTPQVIGCAAHIAVSLVISRCSMDRRNSPRLTASSTSSTSSTVNKSLAVVQVQFRGREVKCVLGTATHGILNRVKTYTYTTTEAWMQEYSCLSSVGDRNAPAQHTTGEQHSIAYDYSAAHHWRSAQHNVLLQHSTPLLRTCQPPQQRHHIRLSRG